MSSETGANSVHASKNSLKTRNVLGRLAGLLIARVDQFQNEAPHRDVEPLSPSYSGFGCSAVGLNIVAVFFV